MTTGRRAVPGMQRRSIGSPAITASFGRLAKYAAAPVLAQSVPRAHSSVAPSIAPPSASAVTIAPIAGTLRSGARRSTSATAPASASAPAATATAVHGSPSCSVGPSGNR